MTNRVDPQSVMCIYTYNCSNIKSMYGDKEPRLTESYAKHIPFHLIEH